MKKIIFILVIYLFFTGPVMAFILNPPGNPAVVSAPAALMVVGFGLLGLAGICRRMLTVKKKLSSRISHAPVPGKTAKAIFS